MEFTGERYLASVTTSYISYEHWHRYFYASSFTIGKTILDIASGDGYGSSLLAKSAKEVVGVDISEETIQWATENYPVGNLKFMQGSCRSIPIAGKSVFDVIVSFETIEHIPMEDQELFLQEIKRLLKPDGILIISTPNKALYSDRPNYQNEFHIKEFYKEEFDAFLRKYFKFIETGGQKIYSSSWIWPFKDSREPFQDYHIEFRNDHFSPSDKKKEDLYLISVCSDTLQPKFPYSALTDLDQQITQEILQVKQLEIERQRINLKYLEDSLQEAKEHNHFLSEVNAQFNEENIRQKANLKYLEDSLAESQKQWDYLSEVNAQFNEENIRQKANLKYLEDSLAESQKQWEYLSEVNAQFNEENVRQKANLKYLEDSLAESKKQNEYLSELNTQTLSKLIEREDEIHKLGEAVEWYKIHYENRKLVGIVKDRFIKILTHYKSRVSS